jgi:hypothetical protein
MSLSELGGSVVSVSGNDTLPNDPSGGGPSQIAPSLSVLLATPGTPAQCDTLASDVTATFAGMTLNFVKDAHDTEPVIGDGCLGWRADFDQLQPGAFDNQQLALAIQDSTETWTIAVPGLHDEDVQLSTPVLSGQLVTVTWIDGPPISTGSFSLTTPSAMFQEVSTTSGGWSFPPGAPNTALVDVPSAAPAGSAQASIQIDGGYTPGSIRCDGPAQCSVDLSVAAAFDVTIGP